MSPDRPGGEGTGVPGSTVLSRPGLRGREAELEQLRALVEAVRDGEEERSRCSWASPGSGRPYCCRRPSR